MSDEVRKHKRVSSNNQEEKMVKIIAEFCDIRLCDRDREWWEEAIYKNVEILGCNAFSFAHSLILLPQQLWEHST